MTPVPYQMHQRTVDYSGGMPGVAQMTGNIPVSGVYAGGGTVSIEARFNGGSWQTIATGVTGSFSGTLTGQAVGSGSLDVRVASNPLLARSIHHVGLGDLYVVAGQSNAVGLGTNNQTWTSASLYGLLFGNDYKWKTLADKLDDATGQVDDVSNELTQVGTAGIGGTYWPLLASTIMANHGVPVAYIPCALGGTAISRWQPPTDREDRTTLYGSMVHRARVAGGAGGVRGVLWHQGESDSTITFGLSQAQYAAYLIALGDGVVTDLACPIACARVHLWTGAPATDAAHIASVNNAIAATAGTHGVVLGPNFASPNITSGLHLATDVELADAAARWYAALVAAGLY